MERDKSPTRAVKILTQKEHKQLNKQMDEKEFIEERQTLMDSQRKEIAALLDSASPPFHYLSDDPYYIRNELILAGWRVDSYKAGYMLEYLKTDPIVNPSPGRMLDAADDEEIERAIKAADMNAHHDVATEIKCINSVLKKGYSTFEHTKLNDKTKEILAGAGYACVELHMHGEFINYRIIPKEQYDRVKAKIAGK